MSNLIYEVERNDSLEKLRELIASVFDIDETIVTEDAHFVDDLGVDSLLALELLVTLEREYGLELGDEDLRELVCLRRVHGFLLEKMNGNEG